MAHHITNKKPEGLYKIVTRDFVTKVPNTERFTSQSPLSNPIFTRKTQMRKFIFLISISMFFGYSSSALAEQWIVRTDFWGVPAYYTLNFEQTDGEIIGDIDNEKITGTYSQNKIIFSGNTNGQTTQFEGLIENTTMSGVAHYPDESEGAKNHFFRAWLVPEKSSGSPMLHTFSPENYSNTWDADREPVLTIWPGDTLQTKTIDSGGIDENGNTKALFGNPQTGPFFIAGAEAGDTLVIHLDKLTINRDYADSLDTIVRRALGASFIAEAIDLGRSVKWILDTQSGVARPAKATGALADFSVPLRPMLGGLGVAPGFGWPAITAGDTGSFGGNMDFPEVVEGNTVYLAVERPGALLYLGDAHAAQGGGETTQYALETSMDVTFTVDLIKAQSIRTPRVESPSQIMVLGQAGTMEDALKIATSGMIAWLQKDYGYTLSEAAQVMGAAIKYNVVNLAGRNVGIAAKLDKSLLPKSKGFVSRTR
jgi:amidase